MEFDIACIMSLHFELSFSVRVDIRPVIPAHQIQGFTFVNIPSFDQM